MIRFPSRICLFAALPLLLPLSVHAQNTLYACVNSSSGTLKIVTADTACKTNEMKLQWDVTGAQGPQGIQGPQGPQGIQGPAGPTNVFGLTVSKTGTGTGLVTSSDTGIVCDPDCAEVYPAGTQVTLTATPASFSTFSGWSGDCSGTGSCKLTLSATRAVTAQFDGSPCPAGPLVVHSTGLGQTYTDCVARGTYNHDQALKAANAWAQAVGSQPEIGDTSCGFYPQISVGIADSVIPPNASVSVSGFWAYEGPGKGLVTDNGTCPGGGNGVPWD